jgi:beta-lactamase regulating signal transducer with metallopeptidase domain
VIWWLTGAAVVAAPIVTSGIRSAAAAGPTVPSDVALLVPAPPGWVIPSALAAWTLFAAAALGRVAIALLTLVRLKRDGQPLDPAIASHLVEWRAASAGGPRTDVRVSDRIRGACALGLGRRVILVSRALVAKLSAADLDAIVMHEGAHLERRDDRWQLVQACAGAIVGWHPAMWYIGRRIRLEREAACDDHVVFRTHAPSRYSRALVRAAGIQASDTTRLASAIPGASVSASLLRIRVRRLLDPAIDRSPAPQLRPSALTVTALVAGLLVIGHVPAVVDFVDAERGLPIVSVTAGRFNELPTVRPVETTMSIGLARSAPARNAGRSDASAIAGPLAGRPLPLSA